MFEKCLYNCCFEKSFMFLTNCYYSCNCCSWALVFQNRKSGYKKARVKRVTKLNLWMMGTAKGVVRMGMIRSLPAEIDNESLYLSISSTVYDILLFLLYLEFVLSLDHNRKCLFRIILYCPINFIFIFMNIIIY